MLRLQHQPHKKQFCQPAIFNKHEIWEKEEITTNDYLKGIVLNSVRQPRHLPILEPEGTIIYVGKAKTWGRRVSSILIENTPTARHDCWSAKIADIRYIVAKTEEDAFLLENNPIKRNTSHVTNVLLKDDKTLPSICVSNEYFPRIFKNPASHPQRVLFIMVRTVTCPPCLPMDLIKSSPPILQLNLSPEKHSRRQVQRMSGISHKELQRPCIGQQSHEE